MAEGAGAAGGAGAGTFVSLGLDLNLNPLLNKLLLAERELQNFVEKTAPRYKAGIKAGLDFDVLEAELKIASKIIGKTTAEIKVGTSFYKTGSNDAASKTALFRDVVRPIQNNIKDDRKYQVRIGTYFGALPKIDNVIKALQVAADARSVKLKLNVEIGNDPTAAIKDIVSEARLAAAGLEDIATTAKSVLATVKSVSKESASELKKITDAATAATAAVKSVADARKQAAAEQRAAAAVPPPKPAPAAKRPATPGTPAFDAAAARQQLVRLTKTKADGGLEKAGFEELRKLADDAGIKIVAKNLTEARKKLAEAFRSAGEDAIKGLAVGLATGKTEIKGASQEVADELIKALKKTLGIASPSKETKKLGGFAAEGFARGLIDGMVGWERKMASAIRSALANAFRDGLNGIPTAAGALVKLERQIAQSVSGAVGRALQEGMKTSLLPGFKGALLGSAGGAITGGLVGAGTAGMEATNQVSQRIASGGAMGALKLLGGDTSAITGYVQEAIQHVIHQALSTGLQGALVGGAGVAAVAGGAGLLKGAGGSLVKQVLGALQRQILGVAVTELQQQAASAGTNSGGGLLSGVRQVLGSLSGTLQKVANGFGALVNSSPIQEVKVRLIQVSDALRLAGAVVKRIAQGPPVEPGGALAPRWRGGPLAVRGTYTEVRDLGNTKYLPKPNEVLDRIVKEGIAFLKQAAEMKARAASEAEALQAARTAIRGADIRDYTGFSGAGMPGLPGSTYFAGGPGAAAGLPSFGQTGGGYVPPGAGGRPPQRPSGVSSYYDGSPGGALVARQRDPQDPYRILDRFMQQLDRGLASKARVFNELGIVSQEQVDLQRRKKRMSLDTILEQSGYTGKPMRGSQADKEAQAVGSQVAQGVGTGLNSAQQSVAKSATSLKDSLIAMLKRAFQIRSPSRLVHEEIGLPIGEAHGTGMVEGAELSIRAAEPKLLSLLRRLKKKLLAEAAKPEAGSNASASQAFANAEDWLKNYQFKPILNDRGPRQLNPGVTRLRADSFKISEYKSPSEGYKEIPKLPFNPADEMSKMMRTFKSQITALTTDPQVYGNLLRNLPDKYLNTDIIGQANDRRTAIDNNPDFRAVQRMLGIGDLEKEIAKSFAQYQRSLRIPDPWVGGDKTRSYSDIGLPVQKGPQGMLAGAQQQILKMLPEISSYTVNASTAVIDVLAEVISTFNETEAAVKAQSGRVKAEAQAAASSVYKASVSGAAGIPGWGSTAAGPQAATTGAWGGWAGTPPPPPPPPQSVSAPAGGQPAGGSGGAGTPPPPPIPPMPPSGGGSGPVPPAMDPRMAMRYRDLIGDARNALYGFKREMLSMGAQSAEVQTLAQAFEDLGIQSAEVLRLIKAARNESVDFIQSSNLSDSEKRRAGNARDIQEAQKANEFVREAQSASGFGGFRGREIGNSILSRREDVSRLALSIQNMKDYGAAMDSTERNTKTFGDVQAALGKEIANAEMALRVLNGTASDGERVTLAARNAWGTILDDFQNLVPQLLVFAVAYNLILQRVMTTPGAVLQAAASFDRLNVAIGSYLSATRGIGDASGEIAGLQKQALALGVSYETVAKNYMKFAASTQGTQLQGQELMISETVGNAARNQGLSGEQVDRATNALTQMLSKGRVQAEELRGQLAEQLPGAVQVAGRAFGVTTAELYRMVEAGQIAGDVFVDKFVKQLRAEGADVNRVAGTFSNVTEQLGVSVQALGASAGQPLLAPLTVGLQALNSIIQTLIPAGPVLAGMFTVIGANVLKATLGIDGLRKGMMQALGIMTANIGGIEGYAIGLNKLATVAKVTGAVLKTALTGAVIAAGLEAIGTAIKYIKGEAGTLGDELKRLQKVQQGNGGLNPVQQLMGRLNVGQNFTDSVTSEQAAKIARSGSDLTKKIQANQSKIRTSIAQTEALEKQVFELRVKRDIARADGNDVEAGKFETEAKRLEALRNSVNFAVDPEEAQTQLTALKAAEQAAKKVAERQRSLGGDGMNIYANWAKKVGATREEFEKAAEAAGLLNAKLAQTPNIAALEAAKKAIDGIITTMPVGIPEFDEQLQKSQAYARVIQDTQLTSAELGLKRQEATLKSITAELQVQENVLKIRTTLIENEKKLLEANLGLAQTRSKLREAVIQQRAEVASTVNAPEQGFIEESKLIEERRISRQQELGFQSQILEKEKERAIASAKVQELQLKTQTAQLRLTLLQIKAEQIALKKQEELANRPELKKLYGDMIKENAGVINSTQTLIDQQGELEASVRASGQAEVDALGIKQEELSVTGQIGEAEARRGQILNNIKAALQEIDTKKTAQLAAVENASKAVERERSVLEDGLKVIEERITKKKEEAKLAEEAANAEMQAVDKMLELTKTAQTGGFFERMNARRIIGDNPDQAAYDLARQRAELMAKAAKEQAVQKRLDLELEKQKLKINQDMLRIDLLRQRLAVERTRAELRGAAEKKVVELRALRFNGMLDPNGAQTLSNLEGLLASSGYNPAASTSASATGVDIVGQWNNNEKINEIIGESWKRLSTESGQVNVAIGALTDSYGRQAGIAEDLSKIDMATYLAKSRDELTATGRILSDLVGGVSDFGNSVASSLADGILGGDAMQGIEDAGRQLSKRILESIIKETITKPMEERFMKGLKWLTGDKGQSDQAQLKQATTSTATNTENTNKSVIALGDIFRSSIRELGTELTGALKAVADIPKPEMVAPNYANPSNGELPRSMMTTGGRPMLGVFDTKLKTGPSAKIGSGADYHQDLMFGSSVTMNERVKLMDELAKGYEAIGRVIEFSNTAVQGLRYKSTMGYDEKASLISRAQNAHADRPGGSGRAALDYYAPLANSDRFGPSVVGQSMLAPAVPGANYTYGSGGGYGNYLTATKGGRKLFELGHGDTSVPIPSQKQITDALTNAFNSRPAAPALPPAAPVLPPATTLANLTGGAPVPVVVTNPAAVNPATGLTPGDYGGTPLAVQSFGGKAIEKASTDLAGTVAAQATAISTAFPGLTDSVSKAASSVTAISQNAQPVPQGLQGFGQALGGVVSVLGSIGMGLAGVQQMGKGGTYNTLMGLAGIFGAIGGIAGAFAPGGGLGGLFRASGGPVTARKPYIVGEQGPELMIPEGSGNVLSTSRTANVLASTRAALEQSRRAKAEAGGSAPSAANAGPIDIRYESQVINNVEYVTADQFRSGMKSAAERGKSMALYQMQNSVKTRRRLAM